MYPNDERPRSRPRVRPSAATPMGDAAPNDEPFPTSDSEEVLVDEPAPGYAAYETGVDAPRTLELREEQLVARKDLREVGEIRVRTVVEEVPGRLEVEAQREEVEIEHVPVGQIVSERVGPYEEDGVLVVPIYEEQLVVVKRLVLKEQLKVRRVASTERQLFEDTLRRDRLVIEDPYNTHLFHEQFATGDGDHVRGAAAHAGTAHEEGGLLGQIRKALR